MVDVFVPGDAYTGAQVAELAETLVRWRRLARDQREGYERLRAELRATIEEWGDRRFAFTEVFEHARVSEGEFAALVASREAMQGAVDRTLA